MWVCLQPRQSLHIERGHHPMTMTMSLNCCCMMMRKQSSFSCSSFSFYVRPSYISFSFSFSSLLYFPIYRFCFVVPPLPSFLLVDSTRVSSFDWNDNYGARLLIPKETHVHYILYRLQNFLFEIDFSDLDFISTCSIDVTQ